MQQQLLDSSDQATGRVLLKLHCALSRSCSSQGASLRGSDNMFRHCLSSFKLLQGGDLALRPPCAQGACVATLIGSSTEVKATSEAHILTCLQEMSIFKLNERTLLTANLVERFQTRYHQLVHATNTKRVLRDASVLQHRSGTKVHIISTSSSNAGPQASHSNFCLD